MIELLRTRILSVAFLILLINFYSTQVLSQAGNYAFSTSTGATLTSMAAGTTTLIGANVDEGVSAITNIGFTFQFACTNYTQFSVSANGIMALGGTFVNNTPNNTITFPNNYPVIMAAWDDMHTGTLAGAGKVHYRLTGVAGSRILTIEWRFGNYGERTFPYRKTVQVRLYETSNNIEIVYGANSGGPLVSATVGIASSEFSYQSINTTSNTSSNSVRTDNNTTFPASGRMYTFTPPGTMAYSSATVTQSSTADISRCGVNEPIVCLEVTTTGSCSPLSLTQIQFAMSGTAPIGAVYLIHIYYTGTTNSFSTTNEFNSGGTSPTAGTMTINGSQTLQEGTNYFWISYDMIPGAAIGNTVDALLLASPTTTCTVGGVARTVTANDPAGTRSIVACVPGPGGINSGTTLWLKADAGSSTTTNNTTVSSWISQASSPAITVSQGTGANQPTYRTGVTSGQNLFNYNPYLNFDGNDQLNLIGDINLDNTSNGGSIFLAAGDGAARCAFDWKATTGAIKMMDLRGGFYYTDGVTFGTNNAVNGIPTTTQAYINSFAGSKFGLTSAKHNGSDQGPLFGHDNPFAAATNKIVVGGNVNLAELYSGPIGEIIVNSGTLNGLQIERIDTYLAIKYGVTRGTPASPNSYRASDIFTLPWIATAAYQNNIIGIGRDDNSALIQKQSHQYDDQVRLYMGSLATTNAGNASTFAADRSFVIIGSNTGALCSTVASNAEKPALCSGVPLYSRLEREWRIQRTNMAQLFNIDISLATCAILGSVNPADLRLLVDNDGNFANGGTNCYSNATNPGLFTYSNPYVIITGITTAMIPANSTRFITIASVNSATPLPVELFSFSAIVKDRINVDLSWSTASEHNSSYFEVHRSQDLQYWENIGYVQAAGNSTNQTNYDFLDIEPYSGINYYRLKQVDLDGEYEYSEIRSAEINNPDVISVFPNPAEDYFVITSEMMIDNEVLLVDINGRTVECVKHSLSDTSIKYDCSALNAGIYFIQVTSPNELKTIKLVIN